MAVPAILAGHPYLRNSAMQLKPKTPTAGQMGMQEDSKLFLGS